MTRRKNRYRAGGRVRQKTKYKIQNEHAEGERGEWLSMENGQCTIVPVIDPIEKVYDVLIVGGGPAGLSAAIYAARSGLSVLVVERGAFGGAILLAKELANYPGGVPGETGAGFSARLEEQAWGFGAEKAAGDVTAFSLDGEIKEVTAGAAMYRGRSLIIATGKAGAKAAAEVAVVAGAAGVSGAEETAGTAGAVSNIDAEGTAGSLSAVPAPTVANELGIPGEKEYVGLGISYCAVCDGAFFSGLDVYMVGEGETAVEEALYLSRIVKSVTVIHRGGAPLDSGGLAQQAEQAGNVFFLPDTAVTGAGGGDLLTWIETENVKTGEKRRLSANEGESIGLFVSAEEEKEGGPAGGALDTENGYIITDEEMRTGIPGVFAAGDVRRKQLRQVVTAAADGAVSAASAGKYLLEGKANGK